MAVAHLRPGVRHKAHASLHPPLVAGIWNHTEVHLLDLTAVLTSSGGFAFEEWTAQYFADH